MPCIMPKPNYIHVINFIKGMQHMTVKAKTKHIIYSEVHIHWETKVSKPPLHIFNGLISRRPAVIGVHWYMLSILLSNQNVFMFNVSGSDRAIRDPIKPELWDLLFALQSSPNCPKTAGNTCLLYRSFSSTAYWGNTHLSYKTQMFTETDRSYIWGQALKLHKIKIRNTLYCTKAEPCRLLIAVSARGNQGGGWRQLFALRWIIDGKTASDRPLYFWIFSNHISSLFNIWIFFHHISSILDSLATAWKENDPSKDDGGASLGRGGGQRWQMEAEVGEPWETNTGDQQAGQVGQTFVFPSSGEVYFSAPMKSICLEGKRSECGGWRNTISTSATKVPSAQTQISCNTRTLNHMDRGIVLNGKRLPRNGQILSLSNLIF